MRMSRIVAAVAALVAAVPAAAADLGDLEFMVGNWSNGARPPAEWVIERWAPARGDVMLGTGLTGRGGKATSYEFMRIAVDEKGEIAFWGSPEGKPPVRFGLVSANGAEAVFVNEAHDYPQRIVYRRTGYGMSATISKADGSNAMSWRYKPLKQD